MAERDGNWPRQSESSKEAVKNSYNLQTLSRVQTVLRAVKQTEALGSRLRAQIETSLFQVKKTQSKYSEVETLVQKRKKLQDECEWRTRKLQREKEKYDARQTGNLLKDRNLKMNFDALRKDRSRLHEKKKIYFSVREELIKSGAQLVMRRKQLISELAFIYPVREVSSNTFTIASIELPNAEQFQGCSDVLIEVAMGYTCHLVLMISHFLDMPLRYVMKHCGSKSLVYDYILDKLNDKEREFVLSSRGHEKFQFDYGVYLLNKNIAQLRYYCGLGTTDLRLTLPNLKTLLQLRLGVNFDHLESSKSELLVKSMYIPPKQKGAAKHSTEPKTQHVSISDSMNSHREVQTMAATLTSLSLTEPQQTNHQLDDLFKPSSDHFFQSPKNVHTNSDSKNKCSQPVESQGQVTGKWNTNNHSAKLTVHSSSLLDQLTKEKLLGPIANDEEIDVSSSEDSASAVYRSKICPRLEENLNLMVSSNGVGEQSSKCYGCDASATTAGVGSGEGSSSDTECSDVEGVATFRSKAYKLNPEHKPHSYVEADTTNTEGEYLDRQISEVEAEVTACNSNLDMQTDDLPTFHITDK